MLGTVTLKMEATVLNCSSCSQPLKPRQVYKCVDIHLVCHRYVRKITSCQKCEHPSSGFTHEPAMDAILSAARVECAHKGCNSLLPYYELHEHEIMCRYAPYTCTKTGCDFAAPPPALVAPLVSAVCVRAMMGDLPVYRVRMWAECPPLLSWTDGRRRTRSVTVELDAPSSAKPDEVAFEDLTSYLAALPHYLVGPTTSKELHFFFHVEF